MHCIEMELETKPETEPWYGAMDLGVDVISSPMDFELIDLESEVPLVSLDTETEAGRSDGRDEGFAGGPLDEAMGGEMLNSSVSMESDTERTGTPPVVTPTPTNVSGEVLIVESEVNGLDGERRRLLDKDNKENDRISISAKQRDRVGSSQVVDDEEERVVENGEASIIESSEECMIVEEQKPNFLLAPKSWVCT
jgi:hypothetical protein